MAQVQTSLDRPRVVIDAVELEGAAHLPETVKKQLVDSLKQQEYEETSDWIRDVEDRVLRAESDGWPDRENEGYIGFSVSAQWKPMRREAGLVHVSLTIQVDEGSQKRVAEIDFRYVGAQSAPPAFAKADLRKLIPVEDGELYNHDKYYAGLWAISRAYSEKGFIGSTVTNSMEVNQVNQTIAIMVEISEGEQYRWGHIDVLGLDPKVEALLKWEIKTGSPVNLRLIDVFFRDNKSLLPVGASPDSVKWRPDAQRAVVDLTFDFRPPVLPPGESQPFSLQITASADFVVSSLE